MEFDDNRLLDTLDKMNERLGKLEVSVANIEGRMSPNKQGAPIIPPAGTIQGVSLNDVLTSKYGIFMGAAAVITALGAVLSNVFGK